MNATWSKSVVQWRERGYLCLSVPFTWLLPAARAIALSHPNERIAVGGPGAKLLPDYAATFGEVEPFQPEGVLQRHHPEATRTSIGCPNGCWFCSVRVISGEFRVMNRWPLGRIICDDNLLAAGLPHLEKVHDTLGEALDLQGVDPALVTPEIADRLWRMKPRWVRMGWDTPEDEASLQRAIELLHDAGVPMKRIHVYCLVNAGESPAEARDRLERARDCGVVGYAMRMQHPTLKKNEWLSPQWTERKLIDFCRYWNRQSWLGGLSMEEYSSHRPPPAAQGRLL